ncbi:MAG TPA: hypothetical protein DIW44_15670 [Anaerolineaceae bacterium]|nr:hypothetical protein [Anaerolineaceae bacterium]
MAELTNIQRLDRTSPMCAQRRLSDFEAPVEVQVKQQVQALFQVWNEKKGFSADAKTVVIAGSWALYGLTLDWSHDKRWSSSEVFAGKVMPILYAAMQLEV